MYVCAYSAFQPMSCHVCVAFGLSFPYQNLFRSFVQIISLADSNEHVSLHSFFLSLFLIVSRVSYPSVGCSSVNWLGIELNWFRFGRASNSTMETRKEVLIPLALTAFYRLWLWVCADDGFLFIFCSCFTFAFVLLVHWSELVRYSYWLVLLLLLVFISFPMCPHTSSEIAIDERNKGRLMYIFSRMQIPSKKLTKPFITFSCCTDCAQFETRKMCELFQRICFISIFRRVATTANAAPDSNPSCLTKSIPCEWFAQSIQYFSIEFFLLSKLVLCSRCNDYEKLSRISSTTRPIYALKLKPIHWEFYST